ncbi:MoaD/ThiS family protein [Natronolimnobius sp. AArcel1]|uniref:ubiquitin-like small modifier protein 1 n=1 Tax=Natronolimnobius sp. AArcel1 TaxID=1679093 RepID=UPI0013EE22E6|nr:ubiquitin-like small modifier protein 1 [Natronolimnobius sp. AArcel1]NGM67764.1 MoaD/ThiS family protein [Natronolimnobius sp. AArcel1]
MTHHVTCTLYGPLREIVGTKSLEREIDAEETAGDVFDDLAAEYPDLRALLFDEDRTFSDSISVMKNGRNVAFEDGIDTPLEDGDTLSASPPAEGGCGR